MEKKKIAPKKAVVETPVLVVPEKPNLTAEAQEIALAKLQKTERRTKNVAPKVDRKDKVQRVTVDFPVYLYNQLKDETDLLGDSLRNFIVLRIREYFDKKSVQ